MKPVFHLATLFARREAKTRIRHRDWLKLAGEKACREQVGTVPTFLPVRANKVAKWKTGFILQQIATTLGDLTTTLCLDKNFVYSCDCLLLNHVRYFVMYSTNRARELQK